MINVTTLGLAIVAGVTTVSSFSGSNLPDITTLPLFAIGPEEIFEGKIAAFDINFFNPKQVYVEFQDENGNKTTKEIQDYDAYMANNPKASATRYYYIDDESGEEVATSKQNTAMDLSKTISKWYYSIRNLALVVMMLILLYIGIRMLLCSIASEKSKYKKMLVDWLVSMCLIFVLHYIMVFAVNTNENVIKIVSEGTAKKTAYLIRFDEGDNGMDKDRKTSFIKSLAETTGTEYNENYINKDGNTFLTKDSDATKNIDDIKGIVWFTNLTGQIRLASQNLDGTTEYVGYTIAYLVLVFYTVFFSFTYLKRVLYMAFLTIIAPLVAMTYSLDKIADGKAQAFNMWLKEYIFNLLIQPMHLLLYTILISMAYDLASKSVIYTLVAIGFMIPAERFVRKMFGFEKAQTPGMLGGAAGAALTMTGMQKLAHIAGHGPAPKGGNKPVEKLDKSKDSSANSGKGIGLDALAERAKSEEVGDSKEKEEPDNKNTDTLENDEIEDAEKNANPLDYLSPEDRKKYDIANARSTNSQLQFEEQLAANKERNELEKKAEQAKLKHFNEEREKRRILDESKRRQTERQRPNRPKTRFEKVRDRVNGFGDYVSNTPVGKASKWTARQIAQNQGTIAKTIKTGTKLTGAVVGAGLGAAAGIASGDISKVGQNVALGATAGSSIGAGISNFAGDRISAIEDTYKEAKERGDRKKYGENYSAHVQEVETAEFMKDREARRFFANERKSELEGLKGKERKEKIDEFMQQANKYRVEAGVKDNKIIAKAMKLDRSNPTSGRSMAAAVMANNAKDIKGLEQLKNRFAKTAGNEMADKVAEDAANIAGFYK